MQVAKGGVSLHFGPFFYFGPFLHAFAPGIFFSPDSKENRLCERLTNKPLIFMGKLKKTGVPGACAALTAAQIWLIGEAATYLTDFCASQ